MPFDVAKQFTFALAAALTATAKEAQSVVIADIEGTFTVRTNWDRPSNAMGIKVLPATKDDLSAALVTRADWLQLHESGGDKIPAGEFIAVPTSNVRRTKRDIIRKSQRPRALRADRTVVLPLKNGEKMIFQRVGKGKNSKLVAMYRLIPRANIKEQSTFLAPAVQVYEKRFAIILEEKLKLAIATARP
jgi:hypothetical protein